MLTLPTVVVTFFSYTPTPQAPLRPPFGQPSLRAFPPGGAPLVTLPHLSMVDARGALRSPLHLHHYK